MKARSVLIFFLLFSLQSLAFSPFVASGEAVTVGKVEIKGLYSIGRDEFLEMLGIREGSETDKEKVREGIKRAFLKGIFNDIQVRIPDGDNSVVEVTVRERDFIRKVCVSGRSRLSGKILKGLFMLKEDDIMRYDMVQRAIKDLHEKVAKLGFPEAKISVRTKESGTPHRVDVILKVDTGMPLVIKSVKILIRPPHPLPNGVDIKALYGAMKLSAGDIYNRQKVEQDLKRIRDILRKKGFFKPVAGPYSYHEGELEIIVDTGKHMSIAFTGNKAISTKALLKEVPFFEMEEYDDEVLGEATDGMLSLYHEEGYPFAEVAPVVSSGGGNIHISFFIFEGEKVKVHSIRFLNVSLPQKRLKDVMSLREGGPYNPDRVDKDKEALKELYAALGYLDAAVVKIDVKIDKSTAAASMAVHVEEGKKTSIGSIEITGVDAATGEKLKTVAGIQERAPYNDVDIADARFRILEYLTARGYANVDVAVSRTIQDYNAALIFKVVMGKKEVFGKTIIRGNMITRYEVIRRELQYKEGEPYSISAVSALRQRLYKLGLFTSVDVEAIDGGDDRKDILINVVEAEPGSVEFGVGYADVEHFRGFVQVGYNNLWGLDKQVTLRTEASSLERRVILQYREPWFMGINLPFRTFFLYENKKELNPDNNEILYRLNRYSVTSGVEQKLSETVKGELYYEFDVVNTTDVLPDVILSHEDTGTLAISSIKPALVFDTRDNPFDPKKGIFAGISLKVASFLLLSQTNFAKLELYGSTFQKLSNRIVLAVLARGGLAYGYHDTSELPIVERFFLGGRSTVRGYAQDTLGPKGADGNPTGGNAYLMGSVEFRTSIGRGFGIVPFLDMGNVWQKAGHMDPGKLKYTTGLGFRYSTPVGPLRVDYGYKLNREPGESHGEIHFSIGQAF